MHELSVCQALIEQVLQVAAEQQKTRVASITLAIGPLSGVEVALLRNAYPLAAAGTIAEHAELLIEETEVCVRCTGCGAESRVPANRLSCPQCGELRTQLESGDEMLLKSLELEDAAPDSG